MGLIPNAGEYLLLLYLCVLMSCLRTLCTQFIRARMLNRLVAVDGVLTMAELLGGYVLFLNVLHLGAVPATCWPWRLSDFAVHGIRLCGGRMLQVLPPPKSSA